MRVAQWDEIARLVPKAPLMGVGADMTYTIRPPLQAPPAEGPWMANVPIPHPHNIYLQVWYELGFIGAALLTTFGLLLLRTIRQLPGPQRPFAYATFAVAAVQIGFSYSVWQIWFMCLFSFGLAMFVLGQNVLAASAGPNRITG
jgi:O-antigen ligase